VGGALIRRSISEVSQKTEGELTELYRQHGDAGSVAAAALHTGARPDPTPGPSLREVQKVFYAIAAARGSVAKGALLRALLQRAAALEAKYIIKIITGDLRIGLKESLVEEAIARAFEVPLDAVKRANMLLGDLGETLRLASAGKLGEAGLRLFHPIDFMLASPVESAEEALSYFPNASVEDKYDGIRAQVHVSDGEVRIFSRTRDDITDSFPELVPALAGLPARVILDGEIVAWSFCIDGNRSAGRALPFSKLQQRLGRKKVSATLMRDVPVAYLSFDILYRDGEVLLDRPLDERARVLSELISMPRRPRVPKSETQSSFGFADRNDQSPASILRAPMAGARSPKDLEELFDAARARGNEGLMIKDLHSAYTPGRRGKSWLKMKRELATLDVVVTAVEYGHGKRIGVLSDYTFAVWNDDRLVNIGKAYSGLTDSEIAEMTKWFLAHKTSEHGLRLEVEPRVVAEVAFNNMMRSTRHESGYALRFPRIVRLRPDKRPEDADTLATAKEIYENQNTAKMPGI
jgi:DNA ligase-1